MALIIPEGSDFFNTVNVAVSKFMTYVSKVQVYLDDWDKNPRDVQARIKREVAEYMAANAQFLTDVNDFIQNYPPPPADAAKGEAIVK